MISIWQLDVLLDVIRHPKDHIIGWWGRFVVREGSSSGPRTAIWLRNGWRVLARGEAIRYGDEYLDFCCGGSGIWRRASADNYGQIIRHVDMPTYRRRVPRETASGATISPKWPKYGAPFDEPIDGPLSMDEGDMAAHLNAGGEGRP
jgi:hypothetical protein